MGSPSHLPPSVDSPSFTLLFILTLPLLLFLLCAARFATSGLSSVVDSSQLYQEYDPAICAHLVRGKFTSERIADNLPSPTIIPLDETFTCFMLAFPQSINEVCNLTLPGAIPDDFELRLDIEGSQESRVLPRAFTQYLETVMEGEMSATLMLPRCL